jgi:hypothetical protein
MAGGIESGHHASGLIEHRNSEGDDTVSQLILDGRISRQAALLDEPPQFRRVRHRSIRQRFQLHCGEVLVQMIRTLAREQYAARGRGMGGKATPHMGFQAQKGTYRGTCDVHDLGAVAAGILGCGSVVLGSSEAAGHFYAAIASRRFWR